MPGDVDATARFITSIHPSVVDISNNVMVELKTESKLLVLGTQIPPRRRQPALE